MIMKILKKCLNRETIMYLLCGLLVTGLSFGLYFFSAWLGMGVAAANTVSTVISVVVAYLLNKVFVFRSESWDITVVFRELLAFCGGRVVTFLMETGLLVLSVEIMGLPNLPCKCFTAVMVVIGNYIISKWAVFKRK